MKVGDKIRIHYIDIDGICEDGNIITDGVIVRGLMNGTILVRYKDDFCFEREGEFYPHDLISHEES